MATTTIASVGDNVTCHESHDAWNNDTVLVRFQNRILQVSVVVMDQNVDNNPPVWQQQQQQLVQACSDRTGWPVDRLVLQQDNNNNWARITVKSGIRGGKGGFGTLLKGQSRQAGAKTTTHFGACRDLQGRRLRHVNDGLEQARYREWKQKVDAGAATKEEMVRALLETESGIAGWHLQLPAWADVSAKKEKKKMLRQFHNWKRQEEAVAAGKQELQARQERQVQSYLQSAEQATQKAQNSIQAALKQGLEVAATASPDVEKQPEKRCKVQPDPPTALLTLSGEAVLEFSKTTDRWHMQSQSNFCTMGVVLEDGRLQSDLSSRYYYEILLVTGGLVQVGWATPSFAPDSETGDGVGDSEDSWAMDGSRQIALHQGKTESYGDNAWKAADVVGCSYDSQTKTVSYSLNGKDLGMAFTLPKDETTTRLFPAISVNPTEIVELHLYKHEMLYRPKDAAPIVLATESRVDERKLEAVAKEEEKANTKQQAAPTRDPSPPPAKPAAVEIKALNLEEYKSPQDLEALGLDRLKGALMAVGVKCGGTLEERAKRLFSLKGLDRQDYPAKLLAKKR